jgi:DNA-binding sugar fermentation-stimulating protein
MPYKTGTWGEQAKARYNRMVESGEVRDRHMRQPGTGLGFAYQGEKEAQKLMENSKRLKKHSGADFLWKNKLIEVKTSHPNKNGYWKFMTKMQKSTTNYYFIICKTSKGNTQHIFLIPNDNTVKNYILIKIGNPQKYLKYKFNPKAKI